MKRRERVAGFFRGGDGKINMFLSACLMAAVVMGTMVLFSSINVEAAYAKAKYAGSHKSNGAITTFSASPWVIKSDGKTLAVVKDRETGELVELGLRIKYCESVETQQDATVKNFVTVEKAPMAAYRKSEVLSAPEAVEKIDKMNKAVPAESEVEAPVTVSINKVVEEDRVIKHKVKVIKTDELVRGQQKVTEAGKDGSTHIVKDVVMENGEYAGSKVLEKETTEKAVTKVIYEGTKLNAKDKGELLVQYATRFLGTKYVWGGDDLREGTDCSGFTMRLYEKLGIGIPRTSYAQEKVGEEVEYEEAQPGDLVLYPGHVGIYMGDNKMIHATDNFVKITDDCRYRKVLCIRRILTDEATGEEKEIQDKITQELFDELFKEEYNEGAEEIAKEKLAELKYETMSEEFLKDADDTNSEESER